MLLNPTCELHRAAAKKAHPKNLHLIEFDGSRLSATNGRILASVPVLEAHDEDEPGLIPVEAYRDVETGEDILHRLPDGDGVRVSRDGYVARYATVEQRTLFGESLAARVPARTGEDVKVIIDPRALLELAKALGSPKAVKLSLKAEPGLSTSSVRVEGIEVDGAIGSIAPFEGLLDEGSADE
ncbi:MAG: hypothetical protein ACF8XB_01135 [Planctomycetota bacterium JB042]